MLHEMMEEFFLRGQGNIKMDVPSTPSVHQPPPTLNIVIHPSTATTSFTYASFNY